jgi:transcriptional regulator with XRE-family HTH domain
MTSEREGRLTARRCGLGGILRVVRGHKGWSVEHAAEEAQIGHMTWRRLEAGSRVWAQTYAKVDALFCLHPGTVQMALGDDDALIELARRLGVDTTPVAEGMDPHEFVLRLGLTGDRTVAPLHQVAHAPTDTSTIKAAELLIGRLVRVVERTKVEQDALRALLDLLPTLS